MDNSLENCPCNTRKQLSQNFHRIFTELSPSPDFSSQDEEMKNFNFDFDLFCLHGVMFSLHAYESENTDKKY